MWVKRIHERKKRYVKVHFAANMKTREVIGMKVAMEGIYDLKVLPKLLDKAEVGSKGFKQHG